MWVPFHLSRLLDKQTEIVAFSSLAIALYGYDQGKSWPRRRAVLYLKYDQE